MSARISLSRKHAGRISSALDDAQDWLDHHSDWEHDEGAESLLRTVREAFGLIAPALSPRPKKPMRREREKAKRTKREAKNAETARIYDLADDRAQGRCEACGTYFSPADPPELDHALGRGKVRQAINNVWLVHRSCHRMRHGADPSRMYWLGVWASHCDKYGYASEAQAARDEMASELLSRASAEAGKGAR